MATKFFEIGAKVEWKVGEVYSQGVVLEDTGEGDITIITHLVAGRIDNREVQVVREIVKKS